MEFREGGENCDKRANVKRISTKRNKIMKYFTVNELRQKRVLISLLSVSIHYNGPRRTMQWMTMTVTHTHIGGTGGGRRKNCSSFPEIEREKEIFRILQRVFTAEQYLVTLFRLLYIASRVTTLNKNIFNTDERQRNHTLST